MAERLIIPRVQVLDGNGDPYSGAKLNFYTSGTSSRLATYADSGLTAANANPVVADSAGRFADIWLQASNYKVVLTDSADVTIWTADPVVGSSGVLPEDFIAGLEVSINATDAANDIDIAAGRARDNTNVDDMILAAAITKQVDAAWAVGSDAGGLDTGAVAASTAYYLWLIKRSDTGVVDALISLSSSAPTMPANYDRKVLIGTGLTDGAKAWTTGSVVAANRPPILSVAGALPVAALGANLTDIDGLSQVDGDLMMSDGTDYKAVPFNARRNLLINGTFKVAQRGTITAQGGTDDDPTACDQWFVGSKGSPQGRVTTSQDTTVRAAGGGSHTLKIDCTTAEAAVAAGEAITVFHPIEAQNIQHLKDGTNTPKALVASFDFRSPKTGTHYVFIFQPDGTRSQVKSFTIASADTLEHFVSAFSADTGGTINNDTGPGLYIGFALVAGSTYQGTADQWNAATNYAGSGQQNLLDNTANNIYIGNVQLEVGTVDTPFEHLSKDEELVRCQRYCNQYDWQSSSGQIFATVILQNTTKARGQIDYPVRMRATPTATFSAAGTYLVADGANNSLVPSAVALQNAGLDGCTVQWTVSGATTGGGYAFRDATDTTFMRLSAEMV